MDSSFGGGGDSTYTVHGVQEGQVSASPSFFIHDGVQLESSIVYKLGQGHFHQCQTDTVSHRSCRDLNSTDQYIAVYCTTHQSVK